MALIYGLPANQLKYDKKKTKHGYGISLNENLGSLTQ